MNKQALKSEQASNSSQASAKNVSFQELGRDCYAVRLKTDAKGQDKLSANIGVVVGRKHILVVDAGPSTEAAKAISQSLTNKFGKPIRYVALTHFHAQQSLGAEGFDDADIVMSDLSRRMAEDHGNDNRQVASYRAPKVFAGSPMRLPSPSISFASSMSVDLGGREVRLMHLGRGHTLGDTVVWVEDARVMFTGGVVSTTFAPYCGDGHVADWPRVLNRISAFRPNAIMPSRGECALGPSAVKAALDMTGRYLGVLKDTAFAAVEDGARLQETFSAVADAMPADLRKLDMAASWLSFNVARAYDEAKGVDMPLVWTVERANALKTALGNLFDADLGENEAEEADDAEVAAADPDTAEPKEAEAVEAEDAAETEAETEEEATGQDDVAEADAADAESDPDADVQSEQDDKTARETERA